MYYELTTGAGGVSAAKGSPAQHRATRHKRESQRTRANALLILAADARVLYRGVDHTVASLAASLGFGRSDLIIVRVAACRRAITLIISPRRIWHSTELRKQLLAVRRLARNIGIRACLVPETQLRKQPRLDNASMIAAASDVTLTLSQRFRVEILLNVCGGSATLSECAEVLLDHPDPATAVLALVRARRAYLPLHQPLTPDSRITALPVTGQNDTQNVR